MIIHHDHTHNHAGRAEGGYSLNPQVPAALLENGNTKFQEKGSRTLTLCVREYIISNAAVNQNGRPEISDGQYCFAILVGHIK